MTAVVVDYLVGLGGRALGLGEGELQEGGVGFVGGWVGDVDCWVEPSLGLYFTVVFMCNIIICIHRIVSIHKHKDPNIIPPQLILPQ